MKYSPESARSLNETIFSTRIDGLLYIKRPTFRDERGFFHEVANIQDIEDFSVVTDFKVAQVNHAHSEPRVIRGIHAEGWNKIITVTSGTALCVIVDVRPDSSTFKEKVYFELDGRDPASLFIPIGVGNSFCVLSDVPLEYIYAVDRPYAERDVSGDRAVSLFDPELEIDWPIEDPIISERDRNGALLKDLFPDKA